MAQITLDLPPRAIDAIATAYGYNPATDGSRLQFAKRQAALWAMGVTRNVEADLAAGTARQAALTKADNEVVVT